MNTRPGRTRIGVILALLAFALAATLSSVPAASASPAAAPSAAAPTAKFVATCGKLGPCLVFSRGETESMASGDVAAAIGTVAWGCAFAGPFAGVCGGLAAAAGPGMLVVAKTARKQNKCAAVQFTSRNLGPSGATGEPAIAPCPN